MPAALTHGFPWRLLRTGRRLRLPPVLFEPFHVPSARLQLLFHISLGNVWEYPCAALHSAIAQLVDTLGADRLMWGTDMPNVERFCTYRQSLETFTTHCRDLITPADIASIVGGTSATFFGPGPPAARSTGGAVHATQRSP